MLAQARRPQLKAAPPPTPKKPPLKPATRPAIPVPGLFGDATTLERPTQKKQKKQKKACPACAAGGATCPECQAKGAPTLERPPDDVAQMRRGPPGGDPAERQADDLGKKIGDDLSGTESVGHGRLPKNVQAVAESHLGVSLEGTHIDAGSSGQRKAKDESALAVTEGKNVAFGEGQLSTSSAGGRALLGHELVHVGQQSRDQDSTQRKSPTLAKGMSEAQFRGFLARQGAYMKRLILSKSPADIKTLAAPLNLSAPSSSSFRAVAEPSSGRSHKLTLNLTLNKSSGAGTNQKGDVVAISVGVNPKNIIPPPGLAKVAGAKVETQEAYLVASTIFHELIHAAVLFRQRLDELKVPSTDQDATAMRVNLVHAVSELAGSRPQYLKLAKAINTACEELGQDCSRVPSCKPVVVDPSPFYFLVDEWAVSTLAVARFGVARHEPTVPPGKQGAAKPPNPASSAEVYATILFRKYTGDRNIGDQPVLVAAGFPVGVADYLSGHVQMLHARLRGLSWQLYRLLNQDLAASAYVGK